MTFQLECDKDSLIILSGRERKVIPVQKVEEALKEFALKGRLEWKGKKIVFDPFTSIDFYYEVEALPDGTYLAKGSELAFCEGFLPGNPPWMIQAGVLRKLSEPIDMKWLRLVFPGPAIFATVQEVEALEDRARAPRVVWKNKAQVEPTPFLVLTDRSGGFADLWMDYGPYGPIAMHAHSEKWRLPPAETSWEKDLLETAFIKKMVGSSHYYCPLDQVGKSLTFLMEIGWKIKDCRGKQVMRAGQNDLQLSSDKEKLAVRGKVAYEDHTVELTDVIGAFNRRERFLDLGPDKVAWIDFEKVDQEWGDLFEEEIVGKTIAVKKNHFAVLESLFPKEEIERHIQPLTLSVPKETFAGTLFSYQQAGVDWLMFLYGSGFHGLLADEMGLGKTVQVLAFLSQLEPKHPLLIVMPTSLLFHWKKEIHTFLPHLDVYVHSGSDRLDSLEGKSLILTSYAILRQDQALFSDRYFECVILDEAQMIKNPESQVAQCAYGLQAKMKLALTGTPIENRWDDLWSLFYFLMPELLGKRKTFGARVTFLKKKLRPFILRRTKDVVAKDLPEKIEQTVWVDMDEEQRQFYEEWLKKTKKGLTSASKRFEILEAILRLRQICCHPALVDGSEPVPSAKLERLLLDVETVVEEGRKALIYSQFVSMLHLVEKELKARGIKYVYLDGSSQDREAVVNQFQDDPGTQLFLISLKAGGVGLNLTAADYVFLFDPWWNSAVESQAIDRAHRFGRKETVIARRYVMATSIEEKIMHLKAHKASLSKGLFDFDQEIADLSLDDLYNLLS